MEGLTVAQIEQTRFPDSTAVKTIAYRARERALDVTFVSGHIYRYFDVPAEVYDRFQVAESAGRFLHAEIIDQYDFERLR
jgi:hypothetical protein